MKDAKLEAYILKLKRRKHTATTGAYAGKKMVELTASTKNQTSRNIQVDWTKIDKVKRTQTTEK